MFRSQIFGGNDPLVNVHAQVGDVTHADVQLGGGHGSVLSTDVNSQSGINASVDVSADGNGVDVAGLLGLGCTDAGVQAHVATDDGIGANADVGLDGALINAAASVDPSISAHVGLDGLGDCGCGDTSASGAAAVDADANVSIPDIGLAYPLSLASLDLSGIDLFSGDHT